MVGLKENTSRYIRCGLQCGIRLAKPGYLTILVGRSLALCFQREKKNLTELNYI